MESYQLIDQLSEQEPVQTVCRAFGVKRSSYYDYRHNRGKVSPERDRLKDKIRSAFGVSRRSAGTRTIKNMLLAEGITVGRYLVGKLMSEQNLICKQPGPHRHKSAKVAHIDVPNMLNRAFNVAQPNQATQQW